MTIDPWLTGGLAVAGAGAGFALGGAALGETEADRRAALIGGGVVAGVGIVVAFGALALDALGL